MKKIFKNFNQLEGSKGFIALFTVLIASVILAMAIGIANISLKQIVLSGSGTEANRSFYAADSGVECALFTDFRIAPFSTAGQIACNGSSSIDVSEDQPGQFSFELDFGDSCASVNVDKTGLDGATVITSKGINTPCGPATARTVERVIEVTY